MSLRFLRRRGVKIVLGAAVGVPLVTAGSVAIWIRIHAGRKPPEHVFRPLVNPDGTLILDEGSIVPSKLETIARIIKLLYIFFPLWVMYWFMKWNEESYERWLHKLLCGVEAAGPAFIKLGQWACTRNDTFSPAFVKVFSSLYSEVITHPFEVSVKTIEEDFGQPISEMFREIDPVPIGSGSIGQVHVAYSHSGDKLAVKVMHPNVVETISKDFVIVLMLTRWANWLLPSIREYNVMDHATAWVNYLAAQVDFRLEAEHLDVFRRHFADVDYVYFPKPYKATRKILIEEWVPGLPATTDNIVPQPKSVRNIIGSKGMNAYCKMLLRDNFVHGDMHPGNMLMDVSNPSNPQISLIDVGLVQKLTHGEADVCHDFTASFAHWDSKLSADTLWRMGKEQKSCKDRAAFTNDMKNIFKRFRPVEDTTDGVINHLLQAVLETVRKNHVYMDPQYVTMMWSLLVLEGFLMAIDSNFNVVRHTAPWLISEGHISKSVLKKLWHGSVDRAKWQIQHLRERFTDYRAPKFTVRKPVPAIAIPDLA